MACSLNKVTFDEAIDIVGDDGNDIELDMGSFSVSGCRWIAPQTFEEVLARQKSIGQDPDVLSLGRVQQVLHAPGSALLAWPLGVRCETTHYGTHVCE
jgi:hypothetical protein